MTAKDERIKRILDRCEVTAEIDCQLGNWLVMTDGTLINVGGIYSESGYVIQPESINSENWLAHFERKGSVQDSLDVPNFISAYSRACEILNIHKIL